MVLGYAMPPLIDGLLSFLSQKKNAKNEFSIFIPFNPVSHNCNWNFVEICKALRWDRNNLFKGNVYEYVNV